MESNNALRNPIANRSLSKDGRTRTILQLDNANQYFLGITFTDIISPWNNGSVLHNCLQSVSSQKDASLLIKLVHNWALKFSLSMSSGLLPIRVCNLQRNHIRPSKRMETQSLSQLELFFPISIVSSTIKMLMKTRLIH